MSWTNISKPTDATYTRVNDAGREVYDDQNVMYDDTSVFYDGIDPLAWTDIAKPIGTAQVVAGMATGLITPFTQTRTALVGQPWVNVNKPT